MKQFLYLKLAMRTLALLAAIALGIVPTKAAASDFSFAALELNYSLPETDNTICHVYPETYRDAQACEAFNLEGLDESIYANPLLKSSKQRLVSHSLTLWPDETWTQLVVLAQPQPMRSKPDEKAAQKFIAGYKSSLKGKPVTLTKTRNRANNAPFELIQVQGIPGMTFTALLDIPEEETIAATLDAQIFYALYGQKGVVVFVFQGDDAQLNRLYAMAEAAIATVTMPPYEYQSFSLPQTPFEWGKLTGRLVFWALLVAVVFHFIRRRRQK